MRMCLNPRCPRPETGRGRCDYHRREQERLRSRERRGGLVRGALKDATMAQDVDPAYRHPPKRDPGA